MNNKRVRVASAIFVLMFAVGIDFSSDAGAEVLHDTGVPILADSTVAPVRTAAQGTSAAPGSSADTGAHVAPASNSTPVSNSAVSSNSASSSVLNAPHSVSEPATLEDKLIVPWNEMNLHFREQYSKSRHRELEKLGPIVILREDKMIMRYKGDVQTIKVVPQRYTFLKSVSHIPLAVYVMLDGRTGQLSADTKQDLTGFMASVEKAAANIGEWNSSAESLSRLKQMIDGSRELVNRALKTGSVSSDELRKFARGMAPLVLEAAYEATTMELDLIDKGLKTWKEKMPAEDWDRMHVVVMQPHMPRNENRTMLYFEKLLKQPYEGERIIYCEGSSDEEYAVNLIGTHVIDKHIAVDFFKDPWRMHRDLLGDGAKRYLKKHHSLVNQ